MKKYIYLLLLLIPFNVLAYSNYVIPGGDTIGINIKSNGIIVIGFYNLSHNYHNEVKVGDVIKKVNGKDVDSIESMIDEISNNVKDNKITLTIKRDNKEINIPYTLEYIDGVYKTGLYVKDELTGIGTLTYIDPQTKIYGALGHEIVDSTAGVKIEVKDGSIFRSSVTSIEESQRGLAGSKNAKFYSNDKYGTIEKNTIKGIYGKYNNELNNKTLLKVANLDEIQLGKAFIYTVIQGEEIKQYEIMITNIKPGKIKNIEFEISDEELLSETGGVVQGMSGSPIIQNNMIVGAVTHVIIEQPKKGYGISITNMLEEGES